VGRLPRRWLRSLLPLAAALTVLGGGGLAALETDTVKSYWEGLWWALSLMTTVGFAQDVPKTVPGQALSALLMVLGFVVLALTTAAIASLFVREDEAPIEVRETAFESAVLDELRVIRARIETLEAGRGGTDQTAPSSAPTESAGAPDGHGVSASDERVDADDSR